MAVRCCADKRNAAQSGKAVCTARARQSPKCTSRLNCSQLRNSTHAAAWPTSGGSAGLVCGETDTGVGATPDPATADQCIGGSTSNWKTTNAANGLNQDYMVAWDICHSIGARLCKLDEILANQTVETGCGHDNAPVWTANPCVVSGTHHQGHMTAAGSRHITNPPTPTVCTANSVTNIAVRCCADVVAGTGGRSQKNCSTLKNSYRVGAWRVGNGKVPGNGSPAVCAESNIIVGSAYALKFGKARRDSCARGSACEPSGTLPLCAARRRVTSSRTGDSSLAVQRAGPVRKAELPHSAAERRVWRSSACLLLSGKRTACARTPQAYASNCASSTSAAPKGSTTGTNLEGIWHARSICVSAGARLCTMEEILSGAAVRRFSLPSHRQPFFRNAAAFEARLMPFASAPQKGTGCGHDFWSVWTSSVGNCTANSHYVVPGDYQWWLTRSKDAAYMADTTPHMQNGKLMTNKQSATRPPTLSVRRDSLWGHAAQSIVAPQRSSSTC